MSKYAASILLLTAILSGGHASAAGPGDKGEETYRELSSMARSGGEGTVLFDRLAEAARVIDWAGTPESTFTGHLRFLEKPGEGLPGARGGIFLVRESAGAVHVVAVPEAKDAAYAGLDGKVGNKMTFRVASTAVEVEGRKFGFVKLLAPPERLMLDRLFYVAIVILLFLTMVGMGLTLTGADFALVVRKPLGMIVGPICQFVLLPLLAMGIGKLAGYYETYPFIYMGLILIAATPGGVTSNLLTYFGKGDVALSVSLTAVCTVLALVVTPLLLTIYGSNIPDFEIPVKDVFVQMLVLVIVPLGVGMLVRWKAERIAKKAEKIFAGIGVFALLFLVVVAILGNLDKFADTARYGFKFYSIILLLTVSGMIGSALLAKVARIGNYQARTIAIECGIRNASLAMTVALLIQDRMGDFYSSMFFTSGIYGLWMYAAGVAAIFLFPRVLPVAPGKGKDGGAAAAGSA